jgi:ATP-dependent Clp protease, protease subunit
MTVVERAARLRSEVATRVSRPGDDVDGLSPGISDHARPLCANSAGHCVEVSAVRARVAGVNQNSSPGMNGVEMNGGGSAYGLDDHIYQRLLRERIVFLGSEVRDQNANAICAQLLLLSAEDPDADIFLHINSPGGSVDAGMAIYDTMNYIPNDVATVGMGLAASMGQFLLCAGTKGKRYALPHARIMMHQPSSGMGGSASDIKIQAQQSLHIKKVLLELISQHTGQELDQVITDADRDRWFTADQALDYGFIDQVITSAREAADEGRPARAKD